MGPLALTVMRSKFYLESLGNISMDYTNHKTPYVVCITSSFIGPTSLIGVVVVKAQYKLQADQVSMLAVDAPLLSGDRCFENSESLEYASDFAPFKPKADLLVNATAPSSSLVTLNCGSIDKSIEIYPERLRDTASAIKSTRESELKVPLRYEFCASDPTQNPIGIARDNARLPFVQHTAVHKKDQAESPAALCAMPMEFTERSRHLGTFDAAWETERWPAMPVDFSSEYFNAAPGDQQQEGYFVGDETVSFTIQSRDQQTVDRKFRLPGEQPRVFIGMRQGDKQTIARDEVKVVLDTLWLDVDAGELCVVWRGNFPAQTLVIKELTSLDVFVESISAQRTSEDYLEAILEEGKGEVCEELASASVEISSGTADRLADQPSPIEEVLLENVPIAKQLILNQIWLPAVGRKKDQEGDLDQKGKVIEMLKEADLEGHEGLDSLPTLEEIEAKILEFPLQREKLFANARHQNTRAYFVQLLASKLPIEGMRFHDLDLSGLDLSNVYFRDCAFDRLDFSKSKFSDAQLVGCRMSEVDLSSAELARVTCSSLHIEKSRLNATNWAESNLDGFQVVDCDLTQSSFRAANILAAEYSGGSLVGACFDMAVLCKTIFRNLDAKGGSYFQANLSGSEISNSDFSRSKFVGAVLDGISVEESEFYQVQLNNVSGANSCWISTRLDESSFNRADFENSLFTDCELSKVNMDRMNGVCCLFDRSQICEGMLTNANMMRASFDGANLIGAKLEGSNLYEAGFLLAQVDKDTSFDGSLVQNTVIEKNVGLVWK